jgi:predicted metal-binding membrane protein
MAVGGVVTIAGALQLTGWKAHQLACCRMIPVYGRAFPVEVGVAWRHGLHLGLRCSGCCASLTAALIVVGVMNLPAMTAVAAAISVERLAPAAERVARAIGMLILSAGLFLIARASGLG